MNRAVEREILLCVHDQPLFLLHDVTQISEYTLADTSLYPWPSVYYFVVSSPLSCTCGTGLLNKLCINFLFLHAGHICMMLVIATMMMRARIDDKFDG